MLKKQLMDDVRNYYESHVKDEDQRLSYHIFEMSVTLHFITKYLPTGSKILDIACGTGHYANALLSMEYRMGLSDLSEKNIELTRRRVGDHPNVIGIERSDAFESNLWTADNWDGIMIMGPMYHLISKPMRVRLLKQAYDHLKPGGYLFTGFMSRTGALVYGIKNNPDAILDDHQVENLWEFGNDERFVEGTEFFTHAYFSFPEEIRGLIKESGFRNLHLAGVEGPFGERYDLFHSLKPAVKNKWMQFILDHCVDPHMLPLSKHLLSVARK